MLQKLFDMVEKYAEHKHANKALAFVSFIESSFFPIPPFVLIIAMLSHEKKPSWIRLAIIGTASSVIGGIAAYFVGMFFYGYIGEPLVRFYGIQSEVAYLGTLFKDHVFATILLASISPIPYKVFTISAGLFSVNLVSFITASIIGRSLRFFTVAYISNRYGVKAKHILLKQQKLMAKIFFALLGVGVLYLAFLR
jgi:membrane protein YqaA with SNARE-associated domain